MEFKKTLRRMRLLRALYYKMQFKKELNKIPKEIFLANEKKLQELKGIHKGERCFIIGNGPSLRSDDLDKLKNEYTFASNRIYNIFDETDWRPTFYASQDGVVIQSCIKEMKEVIPQSLNTFIATNQYLVCGQDFKDFDNLIWMPLRFIPPKKNTYKFSEEIDKQIIEGLTITYSCMQIAVYMGFSEIYLLGVDHNYAIEYDADGNVINVNNDVKSYFGGEKEQQVVMTPPKVVEMGRAYISAEKYSKNNGFKIYNATRGGKLEIFERKNFDEIDFNL